MKTKYYVYLSVMVFLLTATSAMSFQKETRDVKNFTVIKLSVPANLEISIGDQYSFEMEGDEDDLEEIETEVDGNVLKIRKEDNWGSWNWNMDKVSIRITLPKLEGVSVSGSGNVYSNSIIESEKFSATVSGSGDMNLKIKTGELSLKISGSGDLQLSGTAENAVVKISGSGDVDSEDLEVRFLEAKISGSGGCSMGVSEKLEASISGSGTVKYKGNPDHVNVRSSGSGSVRKIN